MTIDQHTPTTSDVLGCGPLPDARPLPVAPRTDQDTPAPAGGPFVAIAVPLDDTAMWRVSVRRSLDDNELLAQTEGTLAPEGSSSYVAARLDEATEHLGYYRSGPRRSLYAGEVAPDGQDRPERDGFEWDVWPIPAVSVPEWSDFYGRDGVTWDSRDPESGDMLISHEHKIGEIGKVYVDVCRQDRAHAGTVTPGPLLLAVSGEVSIAFDDEMIPEKLAALILEAARLGREIQGA